MGQASAIGAPPPVNHDYMATILAELERVTSGSDEVLLAFLLGMARREAENVARLRTAQRLRSP